MQFQSAKHSSFVSQQKALCNGNLHNPLPGIGSDEIRLLKLLPGRSDDKIVVELAFATISSAPPYTALSYVWGDPKIKKTIHLDVTEPDSSKQAANPGLLSVTSNLFAALLALRSGEHTQTFWIDAICINQKDNSERSQQLSLMAKIYETANDVIVWLGVADQHTELGVAATVDIASAGATLASRRSWHSERIDVPDINVLRGRLDQVFADLHPAIAYEAMCSLFRRPWFTRVWVFQEICSAKHVKVQIGPFSLLWGDLITADDVLREVGLVTGQARPSERAIQMDIWRATVRGQKSRNLLHMMEFLQLSRSTDPRDKIYSVLGLVADEAFGIIPDYDAPLAEVYGDFVREHIRLTGSLDILGSAWLNPYEANTPLPYWLDTGRDTSLPSWGVDWRTRTLGTSLWRFTEEKGCRAADDTRAEVVPDSRSGVLRLKGIVCSTVKALSQEALIPTREEVDNYKALGRTDTQDKHRRLAISQRVLESWVRFSCQELRGADYIYTKEDMADAIWMTLIAGGSVDARPLGAEHRREARSWVQGIINKEDSSTVGESTDEHSGGILRGGSGVDSLYRAKWHGSMSFVDYATTTSGFKKVFTTEDGHLGAGLFSIREGDLICVLLGGKTPFVLRPDTGHYVLVGECYVHGMMKGGNLKNVDCSDFKELEIW